MNRRVPWRAPRACLLACGLGLLVSACGTLSEMAVTQTPDELRRYARTGDLKAEVDALARPLIESGETPGLVVGVLQPGRAMAFFGYGVTEQGGGRAPDADTLFAIGSLSKGFLAAITALLVDEKVLSWDDTLADLLPPGTPLSDDARRITVLQLATHTSGLPRQPMTPQTLTYFLEYLFTGESFYRHFDTPYALNYLTEFKAPAERVPQYSNLGYGLLGYVLERRTGQSVDALLATRLAKPLGLSHTGYAPELLPGYAERAHGYAGDQPKFIRRGQPVPDWRFTSLMRGSAALYSSARDLLKFARPFLSANQTHFDAVLADTARVRFPRPREAAGIAWISDEVDGLAITYQIGLVAGYTSYIGLDREHGTAVVVLQNSFNWTGSIGHRLLIRLAQAQSAAPSQARLSPHRSFERTSFQRIEN